MGEVYRATDTNLKRTVAIKVLPEAVAADAERLARFQREAEVLARLNHPNIAAIYGLEKSDGTAALVMELIEGEDLSQRIARGAIPLDEARSIAKQVAEALEAAHEQGIIHRDLKPANIKVRPDGTVKVLDFGLAKAMEPAGIASPSVSQSPTITTPAMTQAGLILGTAAYMAPEQARGKTVDKRADIWAFGCVLFEMLTGKRAFPGEDVTDTIVSVLSKEPEWPALPSPTSATVRSLLRRCLHKDPKQRLRDIGEARLALDGAFETSAPQAAAAPSSPSGRLAWMAALAVAVAVIVAMAVPTVRHFRETPPPQLSGRFTVSLPEKSSLQFLMLSPDGRNLAFVSDEGGPNRLWVRPLDSLDARPIPGTDGATFPFWSPDGRNLGFFAQGKLKKIAMAGGPAQLLCDAPTPRGGTWNRDGVIVFAPNITGALFRVPQDGGVPAPVTRLAASAESHRYPEFIAGGNRFVFTIQGVQPEISGIYAATLDGAAPVRLLPDQSRAMYVPPTAGARTGAVLFLREMTAMALPFDAGTLRAAGAAILVAQDVGEAGTAGFAAFSASENGVLLYRSGDFTLKSTLAWVDRSGTQIEAKNEAQQFESLALSPDGKQAAVSIRTSPESIDVWLQDLERGVPTKFTSGPETRESAVWSHDGSYLVFGDGQFRQSLFRKPATGVTAEEFLLWVGGNAIPLDISHDGKLLVYSDTGGNTKDDLWLLPLQGEHKPEKYLATPFEERQAQFSPDGKWIAYSSDESGQVQVYVQPVPATGAKRPISTQGGSGPRWRRDGKELYYISADAQLMAVPVKFGVGTFDVVGPALRLFGGSLSTARTSTADFDRRILYQPSADGQKFLALVPAESAAGAPPPVTIWLNWMAGLNK
jgi:serine/threonine protein kinase